MPPTVAGPLAPAGRRRRAGPPAALVAAAVAVGAIFAVPTASVLAGVATSGSAGFAAAWSGSAARPLAATLVLAAAVTVSTAAIGTALAFLTVRTDLPGRRAWRVLCPLPLVVPSYVGAAALLAALAPGGAAAALLGERLPDPSGFAGAYLVLTVLSYPYVYLPVAARLSQLDPAVEESARLLGRRPAAVVATVVLPQAAPAVAAGALLVALYTVSDFGAVQLMRYDTLTRRIYETRLLDRPASLVLSLLLSIVALAIVVAERRAAGGSPPSAVTGGRSPLRWRLGAWRWPALAVPAAVTTLALAAPVSVLVLWTGRALLGDARTGVAGSGPASLTAPVANTVLFGLSAAAATIALVLPVAYLQARHRSRAGAAAGVVVVAGFAVPGLVIALAVGRLALDVPGLAGLYQTFPLLLMAYGIHFGAAGLRSATVAVAGVPRGVADAARLLGAGPARRLATVELPLMRPGLLAGAGLVMLSTMKELPATLLLAPTGTETLATRIWSATEALFLGEVGITSLILLAISAVLTWVLLIRAAPG